MNNPKQRFSIYLKQIEVLLTQAVHQENPTLWLFVNDLRTPVFRIEGLARVYRKMHNEKLFEKIKENCKLLEDAFG